MIKRRRSVQAEEKLNRNKMIIIFKSFKMTV